MQSLSVHSHKGGVGKTTIALNMAIYLADKGYNVCIIDHDLSGAALFTFFTTHFNNDVDDINYLTDYLDGPKDVDDVIYNVSDFFHIKGKFYASFADPRPGSIRKLLGINDVKATKMLSKLNKLQRYVKQSYDIDYFIIDTTPGLALTTINCFVNTPNILYLIKVSNADIVGSANMIEGFVEADLDRNNFLAVNHTPLSKISTPKKRKELEELITAKFNEYLHGDTLKFLGWIPIDKELAELEFENSIEVLKGNDAQRKIHTLDDKAHPVAVEIANITKSIFDL